MSSNFEPLDTQNAEYTKAPVTLTIRDVVIIVAAVLSMATAWGLFGTRLSVVEEKIIFIGDNLTEIRQIIKEIKRDDDGVASDFKDELQELETRLRAIETHQVQLEVLLKPKRK